MEITKIVIKSESCWISGGPVYKDKLTITPISIAYEYIPHSEYEMDTAKNWMYKTNSVTFASFYKRLTETVPDILHEDKITMVLDAFPTRFIFTFENKHRETVEFYDANTRFDDWFQLIREIIPPCEDIPECIKQEENEE